MKSLFSQTRKNHFSVLLLSVAILPMGTVFLWFIRHIAAHNDMQMPVADHQHTVWFAAAIISTLVVFLAACLTTVRALRKSHKTLLANNAEMKRTEAALRQSEAHYRIVTESASDAIITIDQQQTILFVNSAAEKIFGYTVDEMLGNKLFMLMPEHLRGAHDAGMKRYAATAKRNISRQGVELPALHKDGYEVPIEMTFGENDRDGKRLFTAVIRDITERKRAEVALRESESKMRALVETMSEGLLQVDGKDCVQFVNDRLCEMVGYSQSELIGADWTRLLLDDEGRNLIGKVNERRRKGISDSYEMRLKKKSGELLWVIIGGAPTVNAEGITTGSMGVFTDISERKRAEEQLLHDAFHDGLTGLANRALFIDHLRKTIERCRSRHSNFYAVLFIDFDRFKVINDSLGHAEGDNLLKQAARRLESSLRTGDLVARLGGDEFVILLSEMLEASDAVQVAERIQEELKNPFDLDGGKVFISASIGIALSTDGHRQAEDMLRDADIAMYRAKAGGKARYQVFDQAIHARGTTQLQLETEMRQAIERREFELHYQPIINLKTMELDGFESLVRWRHSTRGMIPPSEFIPAAEETGLILPLGRWILGESARQLREWQNASPQASPLVVSVNLSCKQFLQSDLAEQVAETLRTTGLDPRCLKLEITESYLIENSEKAVKIMDRLCALGVELSLDDFGTGYSSLSYLHRLPINNLKIDRSFVSRITESEENSEIVRTIIKLAQNLKMKTIAEGIETAEQLAQLNQLNCGYGQGYFFSKPLEAEKAGRFINEILENLPGLTQQPTINLELNM